MQKEKEKKNGTILATHTLEGDGTSSRESAGIKAIKAKEEEEEEEERKEGIEGEDPHEEKEEIMSGLASDVGEKTFDYHHHVRHVVYIIRYCSNR
jgi:hypothetical protein